MYKQLLDYLKKRPSEYEADSSMLWNDEHISKGMLEAHLNPNLEAASRKLQFIEESVKWIASLCNRKENVRLLDLGCGPGIYTEKFADMGFDVTGIDFSKRSIEYAINSAKQKKKRIHYMNQDYLNIDYRNEFDVITLIYCDFGVLSLANRAKLLAKIKLALKPGGILVLDAFTKMNYSNFKEKQKITYAERGFWSPVPYSCIERTFRYEEKELFLEQYIIVTENNSKCYNNWNQAFDEKSMTIELKKEGFTQLNFYKDVRGERFSGDSKTICVVAK